MKIELKKLASPHIFTFTEDADIVKKLVKKSFEKQKSTYKIKGYRKGSAPREIVEKQVNRINMYRDVFDELYLKAINEKELEVIDSHEFSIIGPFADGQPLTMQAKVYLQPEIQFDIDDLKVKKNVTTITDEKVDKQIELIKKSSAKYVNVVDKNYETKLGDVIIMDFTGRIDDKEFEGSKADSFRFVIGETKFIPGFEEQITSMKVGERSVVDVTFPDDYQNADLQGKAAVFDVVINKIEEKQDKSIAEITGGKNIDEFKKELKEQMINEAKDSDYDIHKSNVLMTCINKAKIEPMPDIIIDHALDDEWHSMLYRIDKTEEEYTKGKPELKELFISQRRQNVEKFEASKIFLDFVCKKYDISISEKEVINFITENAKKLNNDVNVLLESIKKPQNKIAVERTVRHEKAVKFLLEKTAM